MGLGALALYPVGWLGATLGVGLLAGWLGVVQGQAWGLGALALDAVGWLGATLAIGIELLAVLLGPRR